MKGKFTILDAKYRNAIRLISEELNYRRINYTIIGGAAVQVHIAESFKNRSELEGVLRRTGDIDIVVESSIDKMIMFFNELARDFSVDNKGVGYADIRGIKINYSTPGRLRGFENLHDLVLNESEKKYLKINKDRICLKVEIPELLIAAKLTGSLKPKDVIDITLLHKTKGENIDENKLKYFLSLLGKAEKFDTYKSITQ